MLEWLKFWRSWFLMLILRTKFWSSVTILIISSISNMIDWSSSIAQSSHHQKYYHQIRTYRKRYLIYIGSWLLYQNQWLLRDFVLFVIDCEGEQRFLKIIWNQMVSTWVNCFSFMGAKLIRDFRRLVNNLERTITKWFQLIRNLSNSDVSMSNKGNQR